jgi:hypothetical protein
VASQHLAWLDTNIPRDTIAELYEREWCLAYAWNAGLERYVLRHGRGFLHYDYAERVSRIYRETLKFQNSLKSTPT